MRRLLAAVSAVALATVLCWGRPGGVAGLAGAAAADAPGCSTTSGPNAAYSATVCAVVPSGPATGNVQLGAEVTVSSIDASVSFVTFCLDGDPNGHPSCIGGGPGYLIRTFERTAGSGRTRDWAFTLPTGHWRDGPHMLIAVAQFADGTQSAPASARVTFANGVQKVQANDSAPTFGKPSQPKPGTPFTIAAVGDAAGDDPASAAVSKLVTGWSPNLFLYLGDVYDQGSYAEFVNRYEPLFGQLRPVTAPVPGNHEYMSSSDPATSSRVQPAGTAYFDYWNNIPNFYSFNAAGWHFVALNANPEMGKERWNDQLDWLQADLTAHAGECTVAFWHEPAFNTGSAHVNPEATSLWSLAAGHAALVVNAHDHTYQRWTAMDANGNPSAAGTAEVIAGTGGHVPGSFEGTDRRQVARSTDVGALQLTPSKSAMRVQFVSISGTVEDAASVPCRASGGASVGAAPAQPSAAAPGVDDAQRTLEIAFVAAIVLAAAGFFLAVLPSALLVALLALSVVLAAGSGGAPQAIAAVAAGLGIAGAVVATGALVGRLLPRRRLPMLALLAISAAVGAALGVALGYGRLPSVALPSISPSVPAAAELAGGSRLGAASLLVAAALAVAVGAHSRIRGLPLAAAIVPTAIALVLADAIVLAPVVGNAGLGVVRIPPQWPLLVAALLVIGWIATEALVALWPRKRTGAGRRPSPSPPRPTASHTP